jgi:hypothetical protein
MSAGVGKPVRVVRASPRSASGGAAIMGELIMTLRSKIWRVVAALFVFVNLFGAGYAAIYSEPMHFAIHAVLLLAAAFVIWRVAGRDVARY